ncbi:hypothetical protein DPMN_054902 [Dreissena polymorpha]|uniref:Uncharacterized protein n=1 Tax=Dreissena polymorpha TaxID=45954 RepID=A0A9D4CNM4_DREPO|nr:hypothetical protein DPMN_054721 [Dreissena polymorpha]KAH3728939.1 hypothetical protein DPMN_054902 [Dreissena polymorpha]
MKSRLLEIIKLFTDPGSESPNAFTEVLHLLVEEASVKLSEFNTWQERMGSRNDDGEPSKETLGWFSSRLEEIIASVLLVVQKQSKSTVSMETGSDDVAKEENEGNSISGII